MGVAGAELSSQGILVTGLAGLLAVACSMAIGEWLSVQSSRELYQRQIAIEASEIQVVPEEEYEELALIYEAKGLSPEAARKLMADTAHGLDTLAREELGINPQELGGSAWEAASVSFLLFDWGIRAGRSLSLPDWYASRHHQSHGEYGSAVSHWRRHYPVDWQQRVLLRAAAAAFRVSGRRLDLWHRPLARRNAGRLMPYMSTALGMLAPIAVKKVVLTIFRRIHEHGKPCKKKDQ
jgi:hypothetical protein